MEKSQKMANESKNVAQSEIVGPTYSAFKCSVCK